MKFVTFLLGSTAVVFLLSLCACSKPEALSEQAYLDFILEPDHGLVKSNDVEDIKVTVSYRPTDLLVKQELSKNQHFTQQQMAMARKKYEDHYYFVVSLSKDSKELIDAAQKGPVAFGDLLQRISFQMSDVVNLTTSSQDTIFTSDYIYNRSFGMSQSTDILFVFDKTKTTSKEWISFNLKEFGVGIGEQSFQFKVSDLENVPSLLH